MRHGQIRHNFTTQTALESVETHGLTSEGRGTNGPGEETGSGHGEAGGG